MPIPHYHCIYLKEIVFLFSGNFDTAVMDLLEDIIPIDDFWAETYLIDPNSVISTNGICIIVDIANFNWRLMKWVTPHNIKMALHRVQTMPIKDLKFHVVNDSFLVHAAIKIIWVILPQHIKDSVRMSISLITINKYVSELI